MIPIIHAGWSQIGVSSYTQHKAFLPPIPALPVMPGLIEGPVPMVWPPGFIVHQKAESVLVDGYPGIQKGHNIGYLIPHFAMPMNVMCAVHTGFSKHKPMWEVHSVLLENKPAGTYLFFLLGIICCDIVSCPTGVVMLGKCTVWTDFKIGDLLRSFGAIALEILFDFLFKRLAKKFPWLEPTFFKVPDALRSVGRNLLATMGNKLTRHIIKAWVVKPLTKDLPRGKAGLGRGRAYVKFFDFGWW